MKKTLNVPMLLFIIVILLFAMSLSHVLIKDFIGIGLPTITSDVLFVILFIYIFRKFRLGVKKQKGSEKFEGQDEKQSLKINNSAYRDKSDMNVKKISLIFISVLLLLAGSFYWFQYRPAQIKHDCSWVKEIESAVPAYPAMTEEELKAQGMLEECSTPDPIVPKSFGYTDPIFEERRRKSLTSSCKRRNNQIIEEYSSAREAIPEKEQWRKSTNKEYEFCLRNHGLSLESLYEERKPEPVINEMDTSAIENSIDDLRNTMEQQQAEMEYEEQQRNSCEGNDGKYQGNGVCVYSFD